MGNGIQVADDEIRANWKIRQPSSTSQAERRDAATKECEKAGRAEIDAWNRTPLPITFIFHSIRLLRLENVKTNTVKNPATGVRHHEAKGVGVAELLYQIEDDHKGKALSFAGNSEVSDEVSEPDDIVVAV